MPLLDHFHPPLAPDHRCESFLSSWATRIADLLNDRWLPPEFIAEEFTHAGARLEIDVATFRGAPGRPAVPANGSPTATLPAVYSPPAPAHTVPASFPDSFEVRVFGTSGGRSLVAAVELVSPGNKDRAEERRAFAAKCASYLHQGVAVAVIDIVTNRKANLHNETFRLLDAPPELDFPAGVTLYAAAYRPVLRDEKPEIDVWKAACAVGSPLPELPLRLTGDLFVPVDFEASYQEACRRRRLS
jgi:hypothetical protein